jgi:hypothetical protein
MSDYKQVWAEKYSELAQELYGKDYWDCTPAETEVLDSRINEVMANWMADQVDRAHEEAKYKGLS